MWGRTPQRPTKNRKPIGRVDDHATMTDFLSSAELQLVDVVNTFISYSRMALLGLWMYAGGAGVKVAQHHIHTRTQTHFELG